MATVSILLLAPNGMLGRAWVELLNEREIDYDTADRTTLDLAAEGPITFDRNYGCVINCAAYTAVDAAEEHEDEATAVNGRGVRRLAEACRTSDTLLVNFSTDYVFPGDASEPYPIDHPRDPINAYGRSKAAGEAALEQVGASGGRWLNIRTSWLYASWGSNFVRTMAKLTAEKQTLQVVADQHGRPTSAQHLAAASLALIESGATGHAHVTDGGECTWYEFTRAINDHLGHTCDIQPCTSAQYPRPAKRPAYSVLDLSRTEERIGKMRDWRSNLHQVLQQADISRKDAKAQREENV